MTSDSLDRAEYLTGHGIEPDPDTLDRRFHLALVLVLIVVVGGAVAGLFGPRTDRVSAASGGVDLLVDYPSVARPGLAAPFSLTVSSDSALPDPLVIEVAADYLAMFDENGLAPEPEESWHTGPRVVWVFRPPTGATTLTVSLDARIEPAVQRGLHGTVSVKGGPGVRFQTRIAP